jgi:vacuolar-type H+-ATPase subunit H
VHDKEHDDFLHSIRQLKEAEKAAADRAEEARKQAAAIEAAGRERAVEISARATELAVQAKNSILAKEREEADAQVSSILGEAKKQAEKIRARRLTEKDASALSHSVR